MEKDIDPTMIHFYEEELNVAAHERLQRMKRYLRTSLRNEIVRQKAIDENDKEGKLFTSIVTVAMKEYGVTQKAINDETNLTMATIGKWLPRELPVADQASREGPFREGAVPAKFYRLPILDAIAKILDLQIETIETSLGKPPSPKDWKEAKLPPIFYRYTHSGRA